MLPQRKKQLKCLYGKTIMMVLKTKGYLKFIALLCAAVVLCSCENTVSPDDNQASDTSTTTQTESTATETTAYEANSSADDINTWIKDLPRMDGSTSAIPLEIGLKSGFLDISYEQAKELVSHTTTHDSFKRLINGETDLIFSVPISEEQRKMADDAGVKLFMDPVAKEGFVFVVNAENPVDSLTSEQIRKIYSGEITNWSEVGGNDEPIIPYQRNKDSGSQNYMTVFMGDTPLLPPKVDYTPGSMQSLMESIAVYDNSSSAIGYSVYSYAAQMYESANRVKYIAVDGVIPSKTTMADGSYPLLSCTYIIYTDKSPKSAAKFAEKALSDEGQGYVLESGYLPINGMEVSEKYIPYDSIGTGEPKPDDFTPDLKFSELSLWNEGFHNTQDKYYEINFLKDRELQSRINADIRTAMDKIRKYYDTAYEEENEDGGRYIITFNIYCRNGYLSLLLGYLDHRYEGFEGQNETYHYAETLNYDLFSGKQIERFSDLFYEGEEFVPDINKSIADWINQYLLNYYDIVQKQDFSGLIGDPRLFTINGIILEANNPYFTCTPILHYSDKNGHSLVSRYRDIKELIIERYQDCIYDYYPYGEWETAYISENGDIYRRITGSPFHSEEEVKEKDELEYALQKRAWDIFRKFDPGWHSRYRTIDIYERNNCYAVRLGTVGAGEEPCANFDKETLESITMDMLLGENWREYLDGGCDSGLNYIPSEWYESSMGGVVVFAYPDTVGERISFTVPVEKINKHYF